MACRRAWPWLLVLTGCFEVQPPGDLVGAYSVTGTLLEHSCGEQALPAVDPMTFEVELREDAAAGRGYWLVSPPAHAGQLSATGDFAFELEQRYAVEDDRIPDLEIAIDPEVAIDPERVERQQMAPGACVLRVSERVAGTVARGDEEPADADLVGTSEVSVQTDGAPGCDVLLADAGGPWEALPCQVRYALTGVRTRAIE